MCFRHISSGLEKTSGFKKSFYVFKVLMYAKSHSVHWTQEYDQEVGLGLHED